MAAQVKIEIFDETSLDLTLTTGRKVTKFVVHNIDTDSSPDTEVTWRAIAALNAEGFIFNAPLPGHPSLFLMRIIVRGITTNSVSGFMYHESPFFGGPATALIVRYTGRMTSSNTNTFVDSMGKRKPIRVKGGSFTDTAGNTYEVKEDYGTISGLDPLDELSVTGLSYGAPVNSGSSIRGFVNSDVFQGYPPGFWLCTGYQTELSRYSGYYTFSMSAATRVTKDWGEIAVLRNEKTGKYINISDANQEIIAVAPYINDLLMVDGATKVGRYPMANFNAAFGVLPL